MNDLTVSDTVVADSIRSRILTIRGVQVMLDRDLAELYGVPTKRLNEQVKRNAKRFPAAFMFTLAKDRDGTTGRKLRPVQAHEAFFCAHDRFYRAWNHNACECPEK